MYARLWWKEARVFWPIWLALGAFALGVQRLMFWLGFPEARHQGFLISLALSWAALYAVAVAAAAFAGERESGTLVLLDTLPVGRAMLWTGKASFSLISTFALALLLASMGAFEIKFRSGVLHLHELATLALGFGTLLFEAIAWTLLVSAALESALQTALLGLMIVWFLNILISRDAILRDPGMLAEPSLLRVVLACGALALSHVVFTRGPRPDRTRLGRTVDVPDVSAPPRTRRRRLTALASTTVRLAWETVRESGRTWLLLAAGAVGMFLLMLLRQYDSGLWGIFAILASLLAGVSVFGPLNRRQGYRFLVQHGVRPGVAWITRVLVWAVAMAVLTAPLFFLTLIARGRWWYRDLPTFLWCDYLVIVAFIIGLFCGQVLRRGITAWVVSCLAFALLVLPQFGMAQAKMIPLLGLVPFPVLVLAIAWAWSGPWMNDLRGARRWLGLGVMMGAAGALLVGGYIGYRAWSVPRVDPPFETTPIAAMAPVPSRDDAAPEYTRILSEIRPVGRAPNNRMLMHIMVNGWGSKREVIGDWWEANRGLIVAIRTAAEKPRARFAQPTEIDSSIDPHIAQLDTLVTLLGLDGAERRSRGDLAGAWDDLRAIYGISSQVSYYWGFWGASFALRLRTQALEWSLAWAADPGQTPASLHPALHDAQFLLPRIAPLDLTLKAQYTLIARTLRRAERDPDILIGHLGSDSKWSPALTSLVAALMAPSWERERARRVIDHIFKDQLDYARSDPSGQFSDSSHLGPRRDPSGLSWHRGRSVGNFFGSDLAWYEASTPLISRFAWRAGDIVRGDHIQAVVLERAFEQVVALRIWQLEHDGAYPDTLDALVPDLLPRLPIDPFSGREFRYGYSEGQDLWPLGESGLMSNNISDDSRKRPTRPGQRLLYSVGPNEIDNDAKWEYLNHPNGGDLIFPLPEPRG